MLELRFAKYVQALGLLTVVAVAGRAQGIRPLPLQIDPRAEPAARKLEAVTLFDSAYKRPRRIWIYTPPNCDERASQTYPLLVAFDGAEYRDTMPLPLILDTLTGAGKAPAFVAVLIDNAGGGVRIADLGNSMRLVAFLSSQLLPYVRSHRHVTIDPHRVIVTGSSAGGLAAAFVAFERPDLFGNVLSQSGAFWRGAEGSDAPPYEWLTDQIARISRRDVKLFLDVGEYEDHATLGGAGPNFLAANRRFRDALRAKGYAVMYAEIPGGQHGPPYWMQRLPTGIVALTADWH